MEMIYKLLLLGILIIFLISVGFAINNACIDVVSANNYFEEVSKVIKESHYNQGVIEACCEEAIKNGYELSVTVEGNTRPGILNYAKVIFTYKYELKLFGISLEKQKEKIL